MENIKELMAEYMALASKQDAKSKERRDEIHRYLSANATEEDKKYSSEVVVDRVAHLKLEVATLREQLAEDDYKLLPLRYIAQKYFGKSAAWLSQRLNGSEVRGHVYTLNAEQKDIFNRAVQEIGQRIGSLQLA